MRLELGDMVRTSDGQEAGVLDRLILDPSCAAVKTVVLHKGLLLGRSVEAPLNLLDATTEDMLRLTCAADQLDDLPEFTEGSYTTQPPVGYSTPFNNPAERLSWPLGAGAVGSGFAANGPLVSTGNGLPAATGAEMLDQATSAEVRETWRKQDAQNAVLGASSEVRSSDDKKLGTVRGLSVDPLSGQVTRLVLHKGFLGGEEIELPGALIARVDDDVVYLSATATDTMARAKGTKGVD